MLERNTIVLNHYKILNVAGKGGMGRVYHAVDIRDHSHWAIKEDLSEEFDPLLYEEAEVLSGLNHPALPKTRGVQNWNGQQYMVMQFMEGRTLSDMLKEQNKYPEEQVLAWFLQIADVLRYLHGRPNPIVYRDLKPSNIIIDQDGNVKIIDFGIAEEYSSQENNEMQKGGLTKGYAAPEQYSHRFKADVRTDIYALGVTVHYLLTGKNPTRPPYEFLPVRKLAPDVSPAMEEIVKRCLQPNPDMRYKTADALYQSLTHIAERNREIKKANQKKRIIAVSAMAIILALVLFGVQLLSTKRQSQIDAYYAIVNDAYQAAENGQFNRSMEYAERAIALQPDEISGYLAIGYCYMLQEEYDLCRDYISKEILDRFPDCYETIGFLDLMAQLYEKSGKPQEALYYYKQWCNLAPNDTEAWFELTQCYIRTGNYEDAAVCLQTYLDRGGDPDLAAELQKQIRNIK